MQQDRLKNIRKSLDNPFVAERLSAAAKATSGNVNMVSNDNLRDGVDVIKESAPTKLVTRDDFVNNRKAKQALHALHRTDYKERRLSPNTRKHALDIRESSILKHKRERLNTMKSHLSSAKPRIDNTLRMQSIAQQGGIRSYGGAGMVMSPSTSVMSIAPMGGITKMLRPLLVAIMTFSLSYLLITNSAAQSIVASFNNQIYAKILNTSVSNVSIYELPQLEKQLLAMATHDSNILNSNSKTYSNLPKQQEGLIDRDVKYVHPSLIHASINLHNNKSNVRGVVFTGLDEVTHNMFSITNTATVINASASR